VKLQTYAIYDSKVEAYLPPFHSENNMTAIRLVLLEMRNATSNFTQFPEDFTLFHTGEFDNEIGIDTPSNHEPLGNFIMLKNMKIEAE